MQDSDTGIGRGTTLSMLVVAEKRFFVWNAGDSRIYQSSRRQLHLLTEDDSKEGMLTRCIGSFSWRGVFTHRGRVHKNAVFLVCTDGFYKRMPKEVLDAVMFPKTGIIPQQAEALLRDAALRSIAHGEKDDMSAVYVMTGRKGIIS